MTIYSQFQTDPAKENDGVPIEYGLNDDGTVPTFVISRTNRNNKIYAAAVDRETKPIRRMLDSGNLPPAQADKVYLKIFVKSILKGWTNVYGKDNQLLPYNEENAMILMQDLPDLYDELQDASKRVANFRLESLEVEAKN